jgi:HPt (histidine-containing phosphotransfer) domain-containing protein
VTPIDDPIDLDLSVIEDLADGDPVAMAEFVAIFKRNTADGIARVRHAIASGAFLEAAAATHTCIGFTATIGMTALLPAIRALESAAHNGAREQMETLLAQWESASFFRCIRRSSCESANGRPPEAPRGSALNGINACNRLQPSVI